MNNFKYELLDNYDDLQKSFQANEKLTKSINHIITRVENPQGNVTNHSISIPTLAISNSVWQFSLQRPELRLLPIELLAIISNGYSYSKDAEQANKVLYTEKMHQLFLITSELKITLDQITLSHGKRDLPHTQDKEKLNELVLELKEINAKTNIINALIFGAKIETKLVLDNINFYLKHFEIKPKETNKSEMVYFN